MRTSRLFRRAVAGLCAAAMLCGGMAAAAAAPEPPVAPAAVEATNAAPSDAELRAAFSKFIVTYDEQTGGWDLSSPQEQASMEKKSCGLYPYMYVQDDGLSFNMMLTYAGGKKLDLKTVNVSADDDLYTFTCDEDYGGGYDQDLGCWFDLELFHHNAHIRTQCAAHQDVFRDDSRKARRLNAYGPFAMLISRLCAIRLPCNIPSAE